MTNLPLVSVVIPVKNGMPYLVDCIQSLANSSYPNIEIVISDDGSIDGSAEYLRSLTISNLILVNPEEALPIGAHWTFVSSFATGKYIKLLCSDDTVEENGIQNQIEALEADLELTMVTSRRRIIDRNGNILIPSLGASRVKLKLSGEAALKLSLRSGTNIFGEPSTVMFRHEVFRQCLPWSDVRPYLLDIDFYARVLTMPRSKICVLSSIDATFRIHNNSLSSIIQKRHVQEFMEFVGLFADRFALTRINLIAIKVKATLKTFVRTLIFAMEKNKSMASTRL